MDVVNCQVRHRGDMHHVISKNEITVAEVAILRHLHGNDSVISIRKLRDTRRPGSQILEGLSAIYPAKEVEELFGKNTQRPDLPKKLIDIGIEPWSVFIVEDQRAEEPKAGAEKHYEDAEDVDEIAMEAEGEEEKGPRPTVTLPDKGKK